MLDSADAARVNEAVAGLQAAHQRRAARIPAPPVVPQFRTLSTGEVVNAQGKVIYKPVLPVRPRL